MKSINVLALTALIVINKVSACIPDCWAEELGYECCKDFYTDVVSVDEHGNWGMQDGKKCGILEIDPMVNCLPIFPEVSYENCDFQSETGNYDVKNVDEDGVIWGYDPKAKKRCIIDPEDPSNKKDMEKKCWSALLGYNCCSNPTPDLLFKDKDGIWSMEDGKWCGVETCNENFDVKSIDKYGNIWGVNTHSQRNCIFRNDAEFYFYTHNTCRSAALGYMCCKETKKIVTQDSFGFWGIENGKWCGFNERYPCAFYENNGDKCCEAEADLPENLVETEKEGYFTMENGELCGLRNIDVDI